MVRGHVCTITQKRRVSLKLLSIRLSGFLHTSGVWEDKCAKNPFHVAKPWFLVMYKGYERPDWRPVNDFMHDIQDEWWQYSDR